MSGAWLGGWWVGGRRVERSHSQREGRSGHEQGAGQGQAAQGKVKETFGKVVGDQRMEAEGKAEKLHGKAQEIVGKIKKSGGR
ncbi:CsbD family protein [Streptomyces luteoverticillatus]|uniref:CsbD family protein n=1 Tax=Streptomyces luteoverticillatus TaxID=66425 RepID=A0A3Q9G4Y0_STRLT|nr:CsbD family protein [Streptomyces luteoverticillatus]